jgi:hypothetical protein
MVDHVPNLADKRTESEKDMAAIRAFPGAGVPRKHAGLRGLVALNIDLKGAIARLPEPSQFVECAEEKPLLLDAIDARNDNDEAGMQRRECPETGGMTAREVRSVGSIADWEDGDAVGVAVDCDRG